MNQHQLDPSGIMQIGMGFWASKILLTAVNMDLFTTLETEPMSASAIQTSLNLHDRGLYDFLDSLVALGFLSREGLKETAIYSNTPETSFFLDKKKPSYIGGLLIMANNRLYPFWGNLEQGLKTGLPQNETKNGSKPVFEEIYADEERLNEFVRAMGGAQIGGFVALAKTFDFSPYKSMVDVGGAGGYLAIQIALNNQSIQCATYDLPPVGPVAEKIISEFQLSDRIDVLSGDFFTDKLPKADLITMGNILHDWGTEEKKQLIAKAYDSLPEHGTLIIIENIIDDDRRENAFGLMMSLNMLIETPNGFDYSAADFSEWAMECGFKKVEKMPLAGPTSALIVSK